MIALAAGDYFRFNPHLPELVPALLAALVSMPDPGYLEVSAELGDLMLEDRVLGDRMDGAFEWLARELPSVELPPAAEELLTRYAWGMLDSEG